jgi:hypothetical protein
LELAKKGMKVGGAKLLAAYVLIEEDVFRTRCKLITVGSRAAYQVEQVYGTKTLPLLQVTHLMASLYSRRK